jgi:hypothetical protein
MQLCIFLTENIILSVVMQAAIHSSSEELQRIIVSQLVNLKSSWLTVHVSIGHSKFSIAFPLYV